MRGKITRPRQKRDISQAAIALSLQIPFIILAFIKLPSPGSGSFEGCSLSYDVCMDTGREELR